MPTLSRIHLPSWDSRKFVHKRYCDDRADAGMASEVVSLRTFYRIWNEHYPHVIIPAVSICNMDINKGVLGLYPRLLYIEITN